MSDTLKKFMFESGTVRGEIVRLENTWQHAQRHTHYPPAVQNLLGQMLAAVSLLSANLKFDGSLIMQIHGDGELQLAVAECTAQQTLRATAKIRDGAHIDTEIHLAQLINPHGTGRFAITLDPNNKGQGVEPYQGIVEIKGKNLAEILSHYMLKSEQLETTLWLTSNAHAACGLLLQKMPRTGGSAVENLAEDDTWNRANLLAQTLKDEELLNLDLETVIKRLFWEETLLEFAAPTPHFSCRCSRQKVGDMLKMLGRAEIESVLGEREKVEVACDYCGKPYVFDAVDCAQLFIAPTLHAGLVQSKGVH